MGRILNQLEGRERGEAVRCPICGAGNFADSRCRHVRWTFEQGGPVDFARFALTVSPFVKNSGARLADIPRSWWEREGEWIAEQVLLRFDACDGYVFGDLSALDLLARDLWRHFRPEPERPMPHAG
jgi:hypothetical protein